MWQQLINGIIGIWMIILSFFLLSPGAFRVWLFWLGIIVAVLGFWGAVYINNKLKNSERSK